MGRLTLVELTFEEKNYVSLVFANGANVGHLVPCRTWLVWFPNDEFRNIRFQFRNEQIFLDIVQGLKKYKDEKGFDYLAISRENNGYAAQISEETIFKAGFIHLPDTNPDHFCLK